MANSTIQKLYRILRIIGGGGGIIGIIFIGIQMNSYLFAPCVRLKAVVQYSKIKFPPELKDEVKKIKLNGYWFAEVKNKGNSSCTGVSLRLPHSEIFMIKRENLEPVISVSKQVGFIGNLAPLEEVMVYGWTSGYEGPRFKDKSMIRLTYDKGIGIVILKLPLRDYWYWISKHWLLILFLWTIILYAFKKFIFFIIKNIKIHSTKK